MGAAATKCLVCGADLTTTGATGAMAPARPGQGTTLGRRPIALTTVLIILGVIVLLAVGGGLIFASTEVGQQFINPPTETSTPTDTPLPTATYTPTPTETPEPTATPLPPVDYVVQSGDTCIKIALNQQVSPLSIIEANGGLINADCSNLTVGSTIKVPQPTPTPSPLPTATLSRIENTPIPRPTYVIKAGDQLNTIARFYGLNVNDLMRENGITDPNKIQAGQILVIPIELALPQGPTSTPTVPPPYPAPQLLNPRDGDVITGVESVNLQWASTAQLLPGEGYQVTIEDVTANSGRILRQFVTDTRFTIPASFQPQDGLPHLYRWSVLPVRPRPGSDPANPAYDAAGAASPQWSFIWTGTNTAPSTNP